MDRFIRAGAYLGNIILLCVAVFIAAKGYRFEQVMMGLLMAVPPVLSLIVIYCGPDREETNLRRQLTKARMRQELRELESKK